MYKHYIKTNENNEITHAFSDAFRPVDDDCILYAESDIRQFHVEITDMNGLYVNKCIDGDIVTTPEAERGTPEQRAEIVLAKCLQRRAQAYKAEADGLYMEAIFDHGNPTTAQLKKWKDKVIEIKLRIPKP